MNQTEFMREALRRFVGSVTERTENGNIYAIGELHQAEIMARKALATEPAKLIRLTDEEIEACIEKGKESFSKHRKLIRGMIYLPQDTYEWHTCQAVINAMESKNKGQL